MLDVVRSEHLPCEQIMFEITETVAMKDAPKTIKMIREFQENNFEISIDDFGTGYSSLAYLRRFWDKHLNTDHFFTNGPDEYGHKSTAIVSAIIKLAHSLEMDIVAEGVGTASQFEQLKGMMCDQMQEFLLGKPMAAEEFSALLHEQTGRNLILLRRRGICVVNPF